MVFLLPGSIIRSGQPSSLIEVTYLTETWSYSSKTLKSVKFDILGYLITAISIRPVAVLLNLPVRLSSSSRHKSIYGIRPATGTPPFSSSIFIPESKIEASPRNLLITSPFTLSLSSGSRSIRVPRSWAKTPPLSISPTRSTGASTIAAIPIFTMSFSLRFISAGEPAPSITIISATSSNFLKAALISGIRFFL